ncbi:hypothetical protein ABVT39_008376 [Epinephelus coioides]
MNDGDDWLVLRGGKKFSLPIFPDHESDTEVASGWTQYEPWPFMDMIGLAERLLVLTYGADKRIMALEETTAAVTGNTYDDEEFGRYRNKVRKQFRKQYPEKRDLSKLEGETLRDDECPSRFLHNFPRRRKEETGEAWNTNKTTQSLFKIMVIKADKLCWLT